MPNSNRQLLAQSRQTAGWLIAAAVAVAAAVAFIGSFRGNYYWAHAHDYPRWEAAMFPLMVDVFIVVGELGLFLLTLAGASWWWRTPALGVLLLGLAGSVSGNVGDVWSRSWPTRLTHAVPPVAAALAFAIGLLVMEVTAQAHRVAAATPTVKRQPSPSKPKPTVRPVGYADEATAREYIDVALASGAPPPVRAVARLFGPGDHRRRAARLIDEAVAADYARTAAVADEAEAR